MRNDSVAISCTRVRSRFDPAVVDACACDMRKGRGEGEGEGESEGGTQSDTPVDSDGGRWGGEEAYSGAHDASADGPRS